MVTDFTKEEEKKKEVPDTDDWWKDLKSELQTTLEVEPKFSKNENEEDDEEETTTN